MARRVVIDATPLLYTANGIGRMTRMVIEAVVDGGSSYDVVLFGRRLRGPRLKDLGLRAKAVHLRLPRAGEGIMKDLNLVEVLCRGDLYHATDFYLPLERPERALATIYDLIFLMQPETMVDHARLAKWAPRFARRCRRIITISESSKADIVNRLDIDPGRVHVTYPGVDRDLFCPSTDYEGLSKRIGTLLGLPRPFFLGVSCSEGRKNTPLLLDAYERLWRNDPRNDLVLVWDPPAGVRERYGSPGLAQRIHFIGRQSDDVLADLYRSATALVFPSLCEGFGLPILEAMSCGCPVIASGTSSMPEVAGEAAMYIDPRDVTSLTKALEAFENGDAEIRKFQRRGLARAARFSWERCGRETLEVYERCLSEN